MSGRVRSTAIVADALHDHLPGWNVRPGFDVVVVRDSWGRPRGHVSVAARTWTRFAFKADAPLVSPEFTGAGWREAVAAGLAQALLAQGEQCP